MNCSRLFAQSSDAMLYYYVTMVHIFGFNKIELYNILILYKRKITFFLLKKKVVLAVKEKTVCDSKNYFIIHIYLSKQYTI